MATATINLVPSEEVFAAPNSIIYATAADAGDIILAGGLCNINFIGVDTGLTFISGDLGGTVTFAAGASYNTIESGKGNLTVNFKGSSTGNIIEAAAKTTINLNGGTKDTIQTHTGCGAVIDKMGAGGQVRMDEGSVAILTNTAQTTFELTGVTQQIIANSLANVPFDSPNKVVGVSIDNITIYGTESMIHHSTFGVAN